MCDASQPLLLCNVRCCRPVAVQSMASRARGPRPCCRCASCPTPGCVARGLAGCCCAGIRLDAMVAAERLVHAKCEEPNHLIGSAPRLLHCQAHAPAHPPAPQVASASELLKPGQAVRVSVMYRQTDPMAKVRGTPGQQGRLATCRHARSELPSWPLFPCRPQTAAPGPLCASHATPCTLTRAAFRLLAVPGGGVPQAHGGRPAQGDAGQRAAAQWGALRCAVCATLCCARCACCAVRVVV